MTTNVTLNSQPIEVTVTEETIQVEVSAPFGPVWSQVPATADAEGAAGQQAHDSNHLYICVATDTWKRVELETW